MRTLRQAAALLLAGTLLCAHAPAQAPPGSPQRSAATPTDLRRARKAAELGDKAEAAGRLDGAFAAYEEAARYAPQDTRIVERFVVLRSRVLQMHIDAAERAALTNQFDVATEELGAALAIDPTNSVVTERLGQFKSMEEKPAAKRPLEIEGLPIRNVGRMSENGGGAPGKRRDLIVWIETIPADDQNVVVGLISKQQITFLAIFNRYIYGAFGKAKSLRKMNKLRFCP